MGEVEANVFATGKGMLRAPMPAKTMSTTEEIVPKALRLFLRRRLMELTGLFLLALAALFTLALATWSVLDPSLDRAVDGPVRNWLGWPGAVVADVAIVQLGLAAIVPVAALVVWGARWLAFRPPQRILARLLWLALAMLATAGALAFLPVPASWPLGTGLGGNLGGAIAAGLGRLLTFIMKPLAATVFAGLLLLSAAVFTWLRALGITGDGIVAAAAALGERRQQKVAAGLGGITHLWLRVSSLWRHRAANRTERKPPRPNAAPRIVRHDVAEEPRDDDAPPVAAFAPKRKRRRAGLGALFARLGAIWSATDTTPPAASEAPATARREPVITPAAPEVQPAPAAPGVEAAPATPPQSGEVRIGAPVDSAFLPEELAEEPPLPEATPDAARPQPPRAPATAANAAASPAASATRTTTRPAARPNRPLELPSLDILAEPDPQQRQAVASNEELQQNAETLQQVLEDFGVRGQIVNVCPGPVVTLYEFEPAPGIKSSRVIGLADDIARSMCAISARIAVVPGRNVIGIELPNEHRQTVFLREMLESKGYQKSKFNLPLALGKNIAGEPVFADLARMPHLLIAGTTGSGKSVGINTFIMSLLYKHTPETCRLIMIDPKMLELSIYDGIPHLLTPVVTDPRKAVVALKWAVREMEERYQKMAMMGVRNLDGYNARVKQALKKGERVTRTVQTGFDPNTGEPVFEEEELDLKPLPYIVVIIDEMADLMMVAGKDIEGAVQRLAQMARAAGIHVIMATQRPSVDVITGTIKANFPTRISFQVTSKIDSRTILGEQGAEQLLGRGDMLYMAGGGRIVRLHGPFVSDEEVEQVVKHLKKQAPPEYVEAVTSEQEESGSAGGGGAAGGGKVGASGDELYDRAVQVVLRDRKVSTSYIQRRLQIGYNKAATLIERMEEEGLISAPNSKGRREILVGGDSAQD